MQHALRCIELDSLLRCDAMRTLYDLAVLCGVCCLCSTCPFPIEF
jgi:hypothetical protein